MADGVKKKLCAVDLVEVGNLLASLVAEDIITCDEWDRIIQHIMRENDLTAPGHDYLAGMGQSKDEIQKRNPYGKSLKTLSVKSTVEYVSLTEFAHAHSKDASGYVIQSWLRSGNTLALLNLWEKENNPDYCEDAYIELVEKKKAASFTLTPKLWISRTKAIGLMSKQGKSGGTFAHPIIACEFASWLAPEFKLLLLKLSLGVKQLRQEQSL